jgi:RNA polymerase sigma factor (TIGR02999 family)
MTITRSLQQWREGDEGALERLTGDVYRELRRLAGGIMAGHTPNQTVQPTMLVHELYFQLPQVQHFDWQRRGQFFSVAARMMRNILVDYARKRATARRGGAAEKLMVDPPSDDPSLRIDVLLIHELLDHFAEHYPRQARVVELRFFAGLTAEEAAQALTSTGMDSSLRTVERDWAFARAWLESKIGGKQHGGPAS